MLRALAVTTATRSDALPDIPTLAEFVPGYEANQWYGVAAPKDTPAEVIDKLNNEINAVTADPLIKASRETGGGFWQLWNEEALMKRRLGMENETTCIPHSLRR
jgi:tripartite-type tricarboxylate transporter receptor subunit TctC